MSAQEFFGLGVPWTCGPARSYGCKFPRVFVGFSAIEVLLCVRAERDDEKDRGYKDCRDRFPRLPEDWELGTEILCNAGKRNRWLGGEDYCAASLALRREG